MKSRREQVKLQQNGSLWHSKTAELSVTVLAEVAIHHHVFSIESIVKMRRVICRKSVQKYARVHSAIHCIESQL